MELFGVILYGLVSLGMVASCFFGEKGKIYEFPFWAGAIASGWFLPQAIGGLKVLKEFPDGSFFSGIVFASLCNLAMWAGFEMSKRRPVKPDSWLAADFNVNKLYFAGAALCSFGFFFQMKLMTLPDEVLASGQWSGAAVKYLFLANVFTMGFVALWLLYLSHRKWLNPKYLLFIIPCLLLLLDAAVLKGRRSVMMSLVSYVLIGLWLVRRVVVPRVLMITAVCFGLVLINGISIYRSIMKETDKSVKERLEMALHADYLSKSKESVDGGASEFKNYIYMIALYTETGRYDFGGYHWNRLVFSYVPGQIVGHKFKDSLMVENGISARVASSYLLEQFGYVKPTGSTISGYSDAFGSFGWMGWIKFWIIGLLMGVLYRNAMAGRFMGQFLYVYTVGTAMHAISHGTDRILTSVWVYFFALGYPCLYLAKVRLQAGRDVEVAV